MTVTFEQTVGAVVVVWVLLILTRVCWSTDRMTLFIDAINVLSSPYIAIMVSVIGMVFDIVCQKYNVANDAATGFIGAGIGMLTTQAVQKAKALVTDPREEPPK